MKMCEYQCAVCDMDSHSSDIHEQHLGITYYFCSEQCKTNFLAHPQLYLGLQSPKEKGQHVIKKRSFSFQHGTLEKQDKQLEQIVSQLMGVQSISCDDKKMLVHYNLLEITAQQIETAVVQAGFVLNTAWMAKWKRAWIHYTESNELDQLAIVDRACCNKPPSKA